MFELVHFTLLGLFVHMLILVDQMWSLTKVEKKIPIILKKNKGSGLTAMLDSGVGAGEAQK